MPRHSWLGCWAVYVLVWALCLHLATPGWGARRGCVCLGSGFGCAPPLLASLSGCVCAGVGALLAPRGSWLGCAAWVCVFGLGFRLRPATPGWGVGVCVCWCACSSCTPPLLAGVCGLGVFARTLVSAAPRHFWVGCSAVRVLVCALHLHRATPGWGAQCGCVCLGSGFGCAPPLLAGVLGCVCARVRAPLAPRHSGLGCAPWVCVCGLGSQLPPATPGWGVGLCVFACLLPLYPATLGRGARRGCVCLGSGFGCAPPLLAGVLGCACLCSCPPCTPQLLARECCGGVCVWARVSAAPRHSWLGCWAVCVLVWALRMHPATPGWGARRGCVCLGSGFCCAPPLLAGVLGCVCAGVGAPLAPCHSWLGCAPRVCVFGLGFWLRPATPGWGVGLCVCWCGCSACTLPLLAGVRAVSVCVWARALAAPRHSWLGCWGVCVLVWVFCLHPATPGLGARRRCVCLGSGLGCAPPLLAGLFGCVCAGVGAPLAPRHSWLGCAPWVCVFGLGIRLHPATPGRGVGLRVGWCGRSACTPPLLAGMRAVGLCVWARVLAAPLHSWLGWWGVCVLVWALRLHPATPGLGARRGCVCLSSGFGCAPPLLAGLLGCVCAGVGAPLAPHHSLLGCAPRVCVFGLGVSAAPRHSWLGCWAVCVLVWALRLHPATPGWGVQCGCVCLGSGFGCAPPLLAGILGCVCAGVRALPVPRLSWLGCAAWVCVLGLGFWLRPATPGLAVGLLVCSCARSACTLPLLAGVRGVGVCVWARVSAAPRHSWLGCALWVCVLGLGFWLRPATLGWGLWCVGWLLPGTCSCAVVRCVLCALSGFVAPGGRRCLAPVRVPWLWPAACLSGVPHGPELVSAPRPVWSLSVLQSAFPSPRCLSPPRGLAPPALLGGCAGHAEAGREPGSLCLPLAPAEAGALGSLRVVPVRGPVMGLSLAGPSGVCLGLCALRWLACVDPVTDASSFPDRPSFDGGLGRCTGAVSCGRRHHPLRVGGRHARVPCVCACACSSWPGPAGRPPGRVLVRLTFSFGRFGSLFCLAPSGLGLPPSWCLFFFSVAVFRAPPLFPAFFGFRPRVPWALALCVVCLVGLALLSPLCALAPFVLPAWLLVVAWWLPSPPPPPFCVSRFFLPPLCSLGFSFPCPRSRCLWYSLLSSPGCLGPWRCALRFFSSRLSALGALSLFFSCLAVGCSLVLGAPPPLFLCVWLVLSLPLCAPPPLFFFFPCVRPRCLWLSRVSGPGCPGPWRCVLFALWASRFSALRALSAFSVSRLAVGCSLVVAALPPPAAWCSVLFFFLRCAPRLSPAFSGFRPQVPWASTLRVVYFVGLLLLGSPCALASLVFPVCPFAAPRWLLSPPPPYCVSRFLALPLGAV